MPTTPPARCKVCARPLATGEDAARHRAEYPGAQCPVNAPGGSHGPHWCVDLCWSPLTGRCDGEPADWPALLAAAEAERDAAEARVRELERRASILRDPVVDEYERRSDEDRAARDAAEARTVALTIRLAEAEVLLRDHGIGVGTDETEYCVYCDWPFGRSWPSDEACNPVDHRPTCFLAAPVPASVEVAALQLCRKAIEAREAANDYGIVASANYAMLEEQKNRSERARQAHAAAIEALRKTEEAR